MGELGGGDPENKGYMVVVEGVRVF